MGGFFFKVNPQLAWTARHEALSKIHQTSETSNFLLNVRVSGVINPLKILLGELELSKLKEFKIPLQLYSP